MNLRLMLLTSGMLAILAVGLGLYWKGRHEGAAHERPKVAAAQAEAAVARLETEGARQTAQRVEVVVRQRQAAIDAVAQLSVKALTSENAHEALDPPRAARLRDADRQLCLAGPELTGCGADRDAGRGG